MNRTLWMIERILIIVTLLTVAGGCQQSSDRGGTPDALLNRYEGIRVLAVAEDIAIAQDAANLVTACTGYAAFAMGCDFKGAGEFNPTTIADILLLCPTTEEGWVNPEGVTEYSYRDDFMSVDHGLVIFGNPDAPGGVEIFRNGEPIEIPETGFAQLKVIHAIALAAGDEEMIGKYVNIPDDINPGNFIAWCRDEMDPPETLSFEPYDGELPSPTFASDKSIDEILAECPDPFGIRPAYIDLSQDWPPNPTVTTTHPRGVGIPSDWTGANMLLHLPPSDGTMAISAAFAKEDQNFLYLIAMAANPLVETVNLGIASGGEEFMLILEGIPSRLKISRVITGEMKEVPDFAPARIEATIPNPPTYRIYWDDEIDQLAVDCNFPGNGLPYNKSHVESLTGGTVYCTVYHPDGETVRLKALIPSKSPRNKISFPLTKQIPWHLEDPKLYKFRFLYETDAGVDEYIAAFGYNRITSPNVYFRFENHSAYLRGAYDDKLYMSGERDNAFFGKLKADGFNCYMANNPLTPREVYFASEAGMLAAHITETNQPGFLVDQVHGKTYPPSYSGAPSWMGEAKVESLEGVTDALSSDTPISFKFSRGDSELNWLMYSIPLSTDPDGENELWIERSSEAEDEGSEIPECIAYFAEQDNVEAMGYDLFEFVNLARREEWCAGFIIPLDIYDRDEHLPLMTDDFLIIDLDGFPLDMPLTARRGSTMKIPLRYANLKTKGDQGGAVFWKWEEVNLEGRVNYDEIGFKGITSFATLDVIVPDMPGEYRLRFEVLDFGGFVQAFNHLDVVVE